MGFEKYIADKSGLTCLLIVSFALLNIGAATDKRQKEKKLEVSAWLPCWFQSAAFESVKSNVAVFDEIRPFWYELGDDGEVIPSSASEFSAGEYSNQSICNYLTENNIKITPSITNQYNMLKVKVMLSDPLTQKRHINNILTVVEKGNFQGIEINYENMSAGDKDAFTEFVKDLSIAMHKKGKTLTVTLHPKSATYSGCQGDRAQDWLRLSEFVDTVSIMCYDYSHKSTKPGPVAPIWWVEDVISYAITIIPQEKIYLGIPNYGYDWSGGEAREVYYKDVIILKERYKVKQKWDKKHKAPFLKYIDKNGREHQIWFENKDSLLAKLGIAKKYNLKGISIWALGYEDPNMWRIIEKYLR